LLALIVCIVVASRASGPGYHRLGRWPTSGTTDRVASSLSFLRVVVSSWFNTSLPDKG